MSGASPITVAALYQFTRFDDPPAIQTRLLDTCLMARTRGTLLIAREGINGTIAGTKGAISSVLDHIRGLPGCAHIEVKFSRAEEMPFYRMKVRLKKEIVTMGEPDIDPSLSVGHYVDVHDWNDLISDPGTLVIDTRNDYEVACGTFQGAVDPHTRSFRDFPAWFREHRDELLEGRKKVAMFCTGGIRCEKSTSFLRSEGIDEVYHLKGGILKYLEEVPQEQSLWNGECFVFDERVSVKHGLEQGNRTLCRACRYPLEESELSSPHYVIGVCCPHCVDEKNEDQRARYAERQKQAELSKLRGVVHIGTDAGQPRGA